MLKNKLLIVLIVIFNFNGVFTDCGCNKLNRETRAASADEKCTLQDETSATKCEAKAADSYLKYQSNKNEFDGMSLISGGTYEIGTNEPVFTSDRESPERTVRIKDFYIDKYEVSNAEFAKFIHSTKHKTDAEEFGDSFVFQELLSKEEQEKNVDYRVAAAPWWYKIAGVNWKYPKMEHMGNNDSSLNDRLQHPVVHVSWRDAVAYCNWKNKRLPSEAEWETACRGKRTGKLFPWGNALTPKNEHWMNIWQGKFPLTNTIDDGYYSTNPVDKFQQNSYDLYNMVGNVWEWTSDLWDPNSLHKEFPKRVKKGGSYLCHKSYCYRYRCAARSENTQESSSGNLGFRCAKDVVV